MNLLRTLISLFALTAFPISAAEPDLVILDETGVKNLRIETVPVIETVFDETFFSLGHIESIPRNVATVSSRIPGRIASLPVDPGDLIGKGDLVASVESRQPGNPPPTIELTAPISGMLTRRHVRLGDPVTPDTPLLEITDLREIHAVAKIPQHLAAGIGPGTLAHISILSISGDPYDGKMIRFGTSANEESGTIDAIFLLPNPDLRIRPGMRAEFSVVLGSRSGILSVPRAALQGEAANRFVYVKHLDLPNTFVRAPVIVGEINETKAEIVTGLFPGDDAVTRGAYSLSFAGASSISLKEALDAAHGHEHAEDGSELTGSESPGPGEDHLHDEDHDHQQHLSSPLWKYSAIFLGLLLIASMFGGKIKSRRET